MNPCMITTANAAVRALQRHSKRLTDETHVAATNQANMNQKLKLMRKEQERIVRLRVERKRKEYEDQRAYEEQIQKLEEQIREIEQQVASQYSYPLSMPVLNDVFTTNQAQLHGRLPPTSVTNTPTVVQNLVHQDSSSSNSTTVVDTQSSVVIRYTVAQPQTTLAQGVAAYLTTKANPFVAVSTVASAAQPYVPSWRRPHVNLPSTQDHYLNAREHRSDGSARTTTAANVTTMGNLLHTRPRTWKRMYRWKASSVRHLALNETLPIIIVQDVRRS